MGSKVDGRSLHNAALRTDPPPDSGPLRLGVGLMDRTVSGLYGISRVCHWVLVSQTPCRGLCGRSTSKRDVAGGGGDGSPNSAPRPVPATAGALGADGPWPGASSSPGPIPAGGGDSPLWLYEWPVGVAGPRAWEEQIALGLPRTWWSFRVKTLRTWAPLLIVTFTINLKCSLFLSFMSATHSVAQLRRAAHLCVRGWEHGRPGQRPGGDTGPGQSGATQRGPREGGAAGRVQRRSGGDTRRPAHPARPLSASHVPLSLFQPAL